MVVNSGRVLAHKEMARNARVRALIDFLAEVFVKHEGLLGGELIRPPLYV